MDTLRAVAILGAAERMRDDPSSTDRTQALKRETAEMFVGTRRVMSEGEGKAPAGTLATFSLATKVLFGGDREPRAAIYRKELIRGRSYWGDDGTFLEQFVFSFFNSHPLLSILCAHRKHPYSRCERFMVLVSELGLRLLLASVFNAVIAEVREADLGDDDDTATDQDPAAHSTSQGGRSLASIRERAENLRDAVDVEKIAASIVVAVIMTVYVMILIRLAVMDDLCFSERRGGIVKWICARIGTVCLVIAFLAAVPCGAGGIILEADNNETTITGMLRVFAISLGFSYFATQPLIALLFFTLGFYSERAKTIKEIAKGQPFTLSFKELMYWKTNSIDGPGVPGPDPRASPATPPPAAIEMTGAAAPTAAVAPAGGPPRETDGAPQIA